MKKIVFALLSVAAFVACSNDEVSDIQRSAIEFNPTTKNSVRTIATTTATFQSFQVWSYTNAQDAQEAKPIMENETVSKNGEDDWTYENVKYWPYEAMLDFYAIAPTTLPQVEDVVSHHIDVEVEAESAKINFVGAATSDMAGTAFWCQNYPDIVYATAVNLTKVANNNSTVVPLNFRHAMSQVEFKIKNTSTADSEVSYNVLSIMIGTLDEKGTTLTGGIDNKGTYTLPMNASTSSNFSNADSHGVWDTELTNQYPHRFNVATDMVAPGQTMSLTNKDNADDMHMVIPQKKTVKLQVHMGVYQGEFLIRPVIKVVDLDVDWKEGHKYTYTLIVNNVSDPDLEDEIIDFTVTVDDMVIADNQDVALD